jgi:hypothetical protein
MTAAEIPVLKVCVDFNVSFNQTLEHRIVRPVRQQQCAIGFHRSNTDVCSVFPGSKLLTVWFKQ